ncbi:Amine sulfotransferase-like [Oopsacas minuta]|uniref:Amine sulfotransferase-like n=1 Tax=Oopsacas minuta TaxID=111878 RepID=A0AAV7KJH6_9METZ|nr:Amine sulfotransferase-like [Oopsacas minuta]
MASSEDTARYGKIKFGFHGGYLFPALTTKEWIDDVIANFKPRDTDIFVCSFPKSGTNWLCHIIAILKTGKPLDGPLEKQNTDLDIPQLEELTEDVVTKFGEYSKRLPIISEVESLPSPRLFSTHRPHEYLPINPSAKYLYVYRNPKDILVSAYHHFTRMNMLNYEGTFEQFFNLFVDTDGIGYFKHIKGYIQHKEESNLLIISYEELKAEFKQRVEELSHFLGLPFNEEIYDTIVKETDFEAMRTNELTNRSSMMREGLIF